MKIETLVNLTGGELINRPFISEVVFFTDNSEEVSRGSCFFATDTYAINEAVKNGAYAIITDKELPVLDKEIAWIKVDSFKRNPKRIIYFLSAPPPRRGFLPQRQRISALQQNDPRRF